MAALARSTAACICGGAALASCGCGPPDHVPCRQHRHEFSNLARVDRVALRSARLDALLAEVPASERSQHLGRLPPSVRIEVVARTAQLRLTMGFTSVEARNATSRWMLQLSDARRAKELLADGGYSEASASDYALQREQMIEKLVHVRAERDPNSGELRLRRKPRGFVNRCASCSSALALHNSLHKSP